LQIQFDKLLLSHKNQNKINMKKLIIAVAAVAFLASCKKDYVCECVSTAGGLSVTTTADLGKQKKDDAETTCNAGDITTAGGSIACTAKEK